ncbi:trace amine-associated receptor 13c-like [Myxocyprinus asiaticus]|uniref:trace amine-associated receptor 13c-like n=1 Tax=Myxocyprinus asiaticus TaxID=70543 RepID=UPI0022215A25|nr:trace amine-associated receptor 13c-like [Myxocyprinus asiaticus]
MKGQEGEQNKLLTGGDLLMAYETEDHDTQYCFPAINSSCIKGRRSIYEYNVMYLFFSLLSACTVFLNLLVIISISHFKMLHTPTNLLILSLAVADLLVGLIVMPIEAIKLIETCWYYGDTVCRLFMMITGLLLSASLGNLVLIGVDRYVAVCQPLLYPQKITTTKTVVSICICWSCCSAYNSAIVISNGYYTSQRKDICYGKCIGMITSAWIFTDLTISFLFPCTVIITVYLRIFYVAHRQVKVINSLFKSEKCVMEGSVRRKSESKAALTLGIIVTVYLLCWIPYYILSLTESTVISTTTITILSWALYINSGLNPLIYAFFYHWFKMSIKHIFTLKIFQTASSLMDILTDYHS